MPLNNISFVLGQGGLGRTAPGQDYVSGLIFYAASLPSGFSTSNRIKNFLSLADAETAGILNNNSDATAATATYLITTKGNIGDTIQATYTNSQGVALALGLYTVGSSDNSIALQGAAWAAIINAGTNTHGCTASFTTATLTITLPASEGVFPNSGTPVAVAKTGAFAGTLTQAVTAGVGSKLAVMHYHISEYFRLNPTGSLYVGIFAVPGSYTFSEIATLQIFSGGIIRQVGIYKDSAAFSSADITAIHSQCATLVAAHKEIVALYGADISAVSDLATLADLSQLTANYCTSVIAQDGAAAGAGLYLTYGKSITCLGAALGAVSLAAVSESIAWPAKFNMSNGTELDTQAFANGQLNTDTRTTDTLKTQLNNYRYLFLRKFVGVAGTYFNDNPSSVSVTSDYAYISDNRTIQKATRGVYAALVPALNSPITLNSDGTIADYSAAYFQTQAEEPLVQMLRDGDLSDYAVVVNPSQNVLSTSKVTVTISLLPKGTARNIVVNIGFNVTIN